MVYTSRYIHNHRNKNERGIKMKIEIDDDKIRCSVSELSQLADSAEANAKKQESVGNDEGANFYYGRMIAYRRSKRYVEGLLA